MGWSTSVTRRAARSFPSGGLIHTERDPPREPAVDQIEAYHVWTYVAGDFGNAWTTAGGALTASGAACARQEDAGNPTRSPRILAWPVRGLVSQ